MEDVDIHGCFIDFIHYYIDVLSVDLCCISSDIQNGYNVYDSIMLSWLCANNLSYSLPNIINTFTSGSSC